MRAALLALALVLAGYGYALATAIPGCPQSAGTICLVSTPVPTATASSPLILTAPSGITTGDLMVGFAVSDGGTTKPSGWTALGSKDQSANVSVDFSYKYATSGDVGGTTTYNWTGSSTLYACGEIIALRNTAAPGPQDTNSTDGQTATGTTTPVLASLTSTVAGDAYLGGIGFGNVSGALPSALTNLGLLQFGSGNNFGCGLGGLSLTTATSYGPYDGSIASGSSYASVAEAILPAPTAIPTATPTPGPTPTPAPTLTPAAVPVDAMPPFIF